MGELEQFPMASSDRNPLGLAPRAVRRKPVGRKGDSWACAERSPDDA